MRCMTRTWQWVMTHTGNTLFFFVCLGQGVRGTFLQHIHQESSAPHPLTSQFFSHLQMPLLAPSILLAQGALSCQSACKLLAITIHREASFVRPTAASNGYEKKYSCTPFLSASGNVSGIPVLRHGQCITPYLPQSFKHQTSPPSHWENKNIYLVTWKSYLSGKTEHAPATQQEEMSALNMVCKIQNSLFPRHLSSCFWGDGDSGWFCLFVWKKQKIGESGIQKLRFIAVPYSLAAWAVEPTDLWTDWHSALQKTISRQILNQILIEHNGQLEGTFLDLQHCHSEFQRSTVKQQILERSSKRFFRIAYKETRDNLTALVTTSSVCNTNHTAQFSWPLSHYIQPLFHLPLGLHHSTLTVFYLVFFVLWLSLVWIFFSCPVFLPNSHTDTQPHDSRIKPNEYS